MLCPEVSRSEPPPATVRLEAGSSSRLERRSDNFRFNHLVAVTVPGTLKLPEPLREAIAEDAEYYRVKDFDLGRVVEYKFLSAFVNRGSLTALSIDTNVDTQNCFCIVPNKKLVLSLLKDTYQSLGLQGKVSDFCRRNKYKYIVNIPLSEIKHGSAWERKLSAALGKLKFDVILNWEPDDDAICPSSIAKFLSDLDYEVKVCTIEEKSHIAYPKVPEIQIKNAHFDDVMEYVEWLGMVALDANFDGFPTDYINTYEVPEPCSSMGPVKYAQWRGFFTSKKIFELLKAIREFVGKNPDVPWVGLFVQGFTDSIFSWGESQNHYFTHSENSYTFFVNANDYLCLSFKMSGKQYSNKN